MNGKQAVTLYIQQKELLGQFRPSTARQTRYLLNVWLCDLGDIDWREPTLDKVVAYITVPNSPDGKHRRGSCIRAFYKHAYIHGWTDTDKGKAFPNVRGSSKSPKPVPDSVVIATMARTRPDIADAMRLGRYAGLRVAEIAGCHREHLVGGKLLVPDVNAEGGKERWIPAHDEVVRVVSRTQGFVFPSDSALGHWTPGYMSKILRKTLPEPYTAHTLRHAFATEFYDACTDLVLTASVLGHARTSTTERYVKVADARAGTVIRGMHLRVA